ncbi:MAG TPA: PIN domain-containing protein [Stellaceae bacterium]|nr:PIN domain-containing protein [Stellaceae bacterium]
MKVALDTNILVYAEGANDPVRQDKARALIAVLPTTAVVIPVQVLGELFRALTRKASMPAQQARQKVLDWSDTYECVPTSREIMTTAADISATHKLGIWDAVVLAGAAEARCRLLLSEDLQEGFTWQGVTIINPLAAERRPLLEGLLAGSA